MTGAATKETSDIMKELLEAVVSDGTGKGISSGFRVGKTATSENFLEELVYISFIGFAQPSPQVIAIVLLTNR